MTVTTGQTATEWNHLYLFLKRHDRAASEKLLDLIEKKNENQAMIGFAGHFSAGKSTLVNTLLNHEILPSSPIPTSANIVHLTKGKPKTITYFKEGSPAEFKGNLPFDQVESLCRDGEQITRIDLQREEADLPPNVTVLDTPGVDSTNDADRLITESSLHLMDYMYYVMDYNHVQSEVNLSFLLEMQRRGTPFSVVINQVDKHNEEELSLESFKASVLESFDQWGIAPEMVYYTSLMDFNLPFNDLTQLKSDMRQLFDLNTERKQQNIERAAENIAHEALKQYREEVGEYKQYFVDQFEEAVDVLEESGLEQWDTPENQKKVAEEAFQDQVVSFIPNAYLMPSVLREDARSFLESLQPGFKVGMFFTKKKTEEEVQNRRQTFYDHLLEVAEKNLVWPLRDRMIQLLNDYHMKDSQLKTKLETFSLPYELHRLDELVESGATVTGEYVLRYTDQVSSDVKQHMKKVVAEYKIEFIDELTKRHHEEVEKHQDAYEALEQKQKAEERMKQFDERLNDFQKALWEAFQDQSISDERDKEVIHDLDERSSSIETRVVDKKVGGKQDKEHRQEAQQPSVKSESSVDAALQQVNETLQAIKGLSGLDDLVDLVEAKKERLKNRRYTVALFGAFSAGKSSFANALLGEKVLPASPNPTTAAINKISPPDEDHPHRSISVSIKGEADMLEDLTSILKALGLTSSTLKEAHEKLREVSKEERTKLEQKKRSFLQAFVAGYSNMNAHIGETMEIKWDQFASYVADEKFSCFVESMELFYDCDLTKSGVTLVDTPGADSVNARHTDVSFQYIKDADAVLFVTYYNHPFSKADQSFLTQLGRVKDSFAMDKMFFMINASDLAASKQEEVYVEDYVREQLASFQIRHPKLFSLSSKHALEERTKGVSLQSGIEAFEDHFYSFLKEELQHVLVESILDDVEEIKETVREFAEDAKLDEHDKKQKRERLREDRKKLEALFSRFNETPELNAIENKVEKQVHYVHERMMLNFNDLFKEQFNPATINGKSGDVKAEVKQAFDRLIDDVNYEMGQELSAVSLRIERLLQDLIHQELRNLEQQVKRIRRTIHLQAGDWEPLSTPTITEKCTIEPATETKIIKGFKNTRAFFEKNEKETMKENLSNELSPELKHKLNNEKTTICEFYQEEWTGLFDDRINMWKEQTLESLDRYLFSLEHRPDTERLEIALEKLTGASDR
ncbi:hypothetical protein EQV77_03360 [Halobacillus fulvus]|nr:hypothetical protein EQV77_03360 [Halobacillus fulvus]